MSPNKRLFRERDIARKAFLRERSAARMALWRHERLSWSKGERIPARVVAKEAFSMASFCAFVIFASIPVTFLFVLFVFPAHPVSWGQLPNPDDFSPHAFRVALFFVVAFWVLVFSAISVFDARRERHQWLHAFASHAWRRERNRFWEQLRRLSERPADLVRLDEACDIHEAASQVQARASIAPAEPIRKPRRI